jgi:hypothetical protein
MATLWDIVTGNSTLPVAPGNTFWDHINNQQAGGGAPGGVLPVFYREIILEEIVPVQIELVAQPGELVIEELALSEIVIDENEIEMGEI